MQPAIDKILGSWGSRLSTLFCGCLKVKSWEQIRYPWFVAEVYKPLRACLKLGASRNSVSHGRMKVHDFEKVRYENPHLNISP